MSEYNIKSHQERVRLGYACYYHYYYDIICFLCKNSINLITFMMYYLIIRDRSNDPVTFSDNEQNQIKCFKNSLCVSNEMII